MKPGVFVGVVWIIIIQVVCLHHAHGFTSQWEWQSFDNFDKVNRKMAAVNAVNCQHKSKDQLRLPEATLAQMPKFNKLLTSTVYPNRTKLLHLHNMAMNRAFFWSYLLRKLEKTAEDFLKEPGLLYHYFANSAMVTANEYNINGSGLFFDTDKTYPNWYTNLPFNTTIPLFGPRAFRAEDHNSPTNWKREPSNRTIDLVDYGAGNERDYTSKKYKNNAWYDKYLPDVKGLTGDMTLPKFMYHVQIKYSRKKGEFSTDDWLAYKFQGPPSPGQAETAPRGLPVVFTEPYYDCGRSNKWIVSAVAGVVDKLPRYVEWTQLRRNLYTAAVTIDIDYMSIDINPCPLSLGNEGPNYFAGTARCKNTTMCEPLDGWGFRRGGYQCVCSPGYRYPWWQNGPFQGIDIESATAGEYQASFNCWTVNHRLAIPVISRENGTTISRYATILDERGKINFTTTSSNTILQQVQSRNSLGLNLHIRKKRETQRATKPQPQPTLVKRERTKIVARNEHSFTDKEPKPTEKKRKLQARYKRDFDGPRKKRNAYDSEKIANYDKVMNHITSVTKDNCHLKDAGDLTMPGSVVYGVAEQLSNQARTAVRLAHFLSNFLQNIDKAEQYGTLRGDQLLNEEQLFAESFANVMGDLKIKASGIFFDENVFISDGVERELFAPFAFRHYVKDEEEDGIDSSSEMPENRVITNFRAIDYAGYPKSYLEEEWFARIKERWASNSYGLQTYGQRPKVRTDLKGTSLKKFQFYPIGVQVPKESDGYWTEPYFKCDGYVNEWVVTYSIPFFGKRSIRSQPKFKGVVSVDVRLDEIDINQCPMDHYIPNAFKDTALCHFESTYCVDLPGQGFGRGSYKCECRQGYEYPYNDRAWYFDGQTMEKEYQEQQAGRYSRYHTLKCRIAAGAESVKSTHTIIFIQITIIYILFVCN